MSTYHYIPFLWLSTGEFTLLFPVVKQRAIVPHNPTFLISTQWSLL